MTIPMKVVIMLWLLHWIGQGILRPLEMHPQPSHQLQRQRDGVRSVLHGLRIVIVILALLVLIPLR